MQKIDDLGDAEYGDILEPILTYLAIEHTPEKSDVIFTFGSVRLNNVWAKTAELYFAGYAQHILVTGGIAGFSKNLGITSEAEENKKELIKRGVPENAILIENRSTNTLENIFFGMQLLAEKDLMIKQAILVAKPFHMRRCFATFQKQFPNVRLFCCSPKATIADSIDRPKQEFAERLLAELERLQAYAERGDIVYQEVPATVLEASGRLRELVRSKST